MNEQCQQPEQIGAYRVERRLGSGGMGEVFLAWDDRLGRHVAIKRLREDVPSTPERRRRLRQEARAAAALNHPAIVQVHDILEDATGDSIVMEHVEGRSLAELVVAGTVDVEMAVRVARQVAEGLARAHERGLIHRDLKTENVMMTPEGQVKILDFGLAKALSRDELDASLTREGAVLGTVRAMSPEQAAGETVDARSDLYSLGVLLYEMLTGRSPFRGENALQIHRKVLTERPPPPRVLRPELPAELSGLVEALLEKLPEHRPQTAREIEATLEQIATCHDLGHLGALPCSPPRTLPSDAPTLADDLPTPAPPPRRRRPAVWLSALGLLVLTGVALSLGMSQRPPREQIPASAPSGEEPSILDLYQSGWAKLARFYRPGSIDQAIEDFQRVLASGEMQAAAHAGLARAYWRKYLWPSLDPAWLAQATAVAQRAVELDDALAVARVSLALVLIENRRYPEAQTQLEHALLLDPQDGDALLALARLETARGEPAAAHTALAAALAAGRDSHELHDLHGQLYYEEGRYEQAAAEFRRSVELAPDGVMGYRNLASAYFMLGRYGQAATELQKALAIQPTASLYTNLGTQFFYQGLYLQAAEAMEKALALPNGASSYLNWGNLGDAYAQMPDRREDAHHAYRQAIRLLRDRLTSGGSFSAKERSRLALFSAKVGEIDTALAELAQIDSEGWKLPGVLYRAAVIYEVGGRRDDALLRLEKALRAGYPPMEARRDPDLVALRGDARYQRILGALEKTTE